MNEVKEEEEAVDVRKGNEFKNKNGLEFDPLMERVVLDAVLLLLLLIVVTS